ncbi:MAG: InlB B-repeat-containing protein, partial [Clostridia bacterium]|nr:InlB B-repeat-containing protein [Clostridia bacterium]
MKKSLISVLICILLVALVACEPKSSGKNQSSGDGTTETNYTVAFEVDGTRYKTLIVPANQTITAEVTDPVKTGYTFDGWTLNGEVVTLSEYTVTKNVTFTAKFTENTIDKTLVVNDVKVEGKEYYLVVGWWEQLNEDGTIKPTSYMTEDGVRLFYANLKLYLTKAGATEQQLEAISVRNYSSNGVAKMGEAVTADGDVDIMIGVGNNINSSTGAKLSLYEQDNANKFATKMSEATSNRYVALLSTTRPLGVNVYYWLKTTEGREAFLRPMTLDEMVVAPERSINLTVTVHGDTDETTVLTDSTTAVTMPTITVGEKQQFKGFALSADGEVALSVSADATILYKNLRDLLTEGQTTIELYPVIEDVSQEKVMSVYVQVHSTNLYSYEAELLKARFLATLTDEEKASVVFHNETVANDAAFTSIIEAADDVDVIIGGKSPLNSYEAHDEGALATITGKMHFASTSRNVMIAKSADMLDLAKKLYNFVLADAPEYNMTVAYWRVGTWITEDAAAALTENIQTAVNTYFNIGETENLADKYNVKLTFEAVA